MSPEKPKDDESQPQYDPFADDRVIDAAWDDDVLQYRLGNLANAREALSADPSDIRAFVASEAEADVLHWLRAHHSHITLPPQES